jgi:photosystem II stability/assembly factor-like uncharacterized protein
MLTRKMLLITAIAASLFSTLHAQVTEEPGGEKERETAERISKEYQEDLRSNNLSGKKLYDQIPNSTRGRKVLGKSTIDWNFLGPMNQSGRVTGLAISYDHPDLWYCAAAGGGVWRSDNAGESWTPLTDTMASLKMSALAISPKDDQFLLAGTEEGFIYRTTDGGQSWKVIALEATYVSDLQFHPTQDGRILAAAWSGVFESRDSGLTWKKLIGPGRFTTANYNPKDPSKLLCSYNGLAGSVVVQLSKDSGLTWIKKLSLTSGYWGGIMVRYCKGDPTIAYAIVNDAGKVYRSTDGGNTWRVTSTQPYRDGYNRGFDVMAVSPDDPDVVFTGGTTIFRTSDGGATWQSGDTINGSVHVDQHVFLFPPSNPSAFMAGNDGGIFIATNYTEPKLNWDERNKTLATLQIYNCTFHPENTSIVITGCQDNGYDKFTGDAHNWKIVGGDGFCTLFDRESPNYFYHEYVYGNLHRSSDGFTWWSDKVMNGLPTDNSGNGFYTGFTSPDRADWYGQAIAMSPDDSRMLYIGSNFLYKTTDRGDNWSRMVNKSFARSNNDYLTTINPSSANGSIIYLGTNEGKMFRLKDSAGMVTYDDISSTIFTSRVRSFAVSPLDENLVFAAGDAGWQSKGILRSADGGKTWAVACKGLPPGQVDRLLYDPYNDSVLYAGTSFGLFYTLNQGDSWSRMPDFPHVEVWDLYMSTLEGKRTLLAGTYGRGAIMVDDLKLPGQEQNTAINYNMGRALGTISLYPNPAKEQVKIRMLLNRSSIVSVEVYNITGKPVTGIAPQTLPGGEQTLTLQLNTLQSGIYILKLRTGGKTILRKLAVVR